MNDNGLQITDISNPFVFELKKKSNHLKKVGNLDAFLKMPDVSEATPKLFEDKGRNHALISNNTPENGKTKILSELVRKDETVKSNPVKKALISHKQTLSNNVKAERKPHANIVIKHKANYSNIDHTPKSKEIIIETYSDRYKTKKVCTINEAENKDIHSKHTLKHNSDRTHSEVNRSTLGEIEHKTKQTSNFTTHENKKLVIKPHSINKQEVSHLKMFDNKQFNNIINYLKTSYEDFKSSDNVFVLKFKKKSSVIKNKKENVIDVK